MRDAFAHSFDGPSMEWTANDFCSINRNFLRNLEEESKDEIDGEYVKKLIQEMIEN